MAEVDDRKLEVFVAAVEEGSFSKAAQRCHCTQSAVTQLMNALEAELGCKVLVRTHAGVKLTEDGEALFPAVRNAYDALSELSRVAHRLLRSSSHLRIGAYSSIAATWLPEAIISFKKDYRESEFEVRTGSKNLGDLLKAGEIDIALCDDWLFEERFSSDTSWDYRRDGERPPRGSYSWIAMAHDPLLAVVPTSMAPRKGTSIARADLFAHPFLFDANYVYAHFLGSEFDSIVKVSADDSASILSMVASGMGVSVLPQLALGNVPRGVTVLELDPPTRRIIGAVLPHDASTSARAFASFLCKRMRDANTLSC